MKKIIGNMPKELGNPSRFLCKTWDLFYNFVNNYNGYKNLYFAVYSCDENRKYINTEIDKIFFDFDEKDAIEDIKKLHDYCNKNNILHTMVFSGGGYHFYIFTKNGSFLKNPKIALKNTHDFFCKELNLKLDPHIIGDIARISRIPNTYNIKRKKFCIPITADDLKRGDFYIRQKAEKQNFNFKYYGEKYFDISAYDTERIEKEIEFINMDADVKIKIEKNEILKKLPPCLAKMLADGEPHWRERFLIITYLRDYGYMKNETIEILRQFLSEKKFKHCIYEERQVDYLYTRCDLVFPSCKTIQSEGYCVKNCKFKINLYR